MSTYICYRSQELLHVCVSAPCGSKSTMPRIRLFAHLLQCDKIKALHSYEQLRSSTNLSSHIHDIFSI